MFLPIGDTPKPPVTPYVTYLLIAVNIAVFVLVSLPAMLRPVAPGDPLLLDYLHSLGLHGLVPLRQVVEQVSAYDLMVFRYGFRPADPSLTALFTALFLHGGWLHLGGNMLFLWIFGDNVEYRLGRLAYLSTYLAAGVAATLFFALFVPGSQVPLVGASGAISGVLGCYFFWYPRNRVKVFVFLFPLIMTTLMVPARWVLGFYLLIDNLLPFVFDRQGGSGVAHGAHIGGFLAGLALAAVLERLPEYRRQRSRGRYSGDFVFERMEPERSPREQLVQLLAAGETDAAARFYLHGATAELYRSLSSGEILLLVEALLNNGEHEAALFLCRRLIAERPGDRNFARACLAAGIALLRRPRGTTNAYHYFLSALDAAEEPQVAALARQYLSLIEAGRAEKP